MPYSVRKQGAKWEIVKTSTGKVVGTSTSKTKAQASVRARYLAENGKPIKKIKRLG